MAMVGMAASATLTQFSTSSLSSAASTSFGNSQLALTLPGPLRFRRTRRSSTLGNSSFHPDFVYFQHMYHWDALHIAISEV